MILIFVWNFVIFRKKMPTDFSKIKEEEKKEFFGRVIAKKTKKRSIHLLLDKGNVLIELLNKTDFFKSIFQFSIMKIHSYI